MGKETNNQRKTQDIQYVATGGDGELHSSGVTRCGWNN